MFAPGSIPEGKQQVPRVAGDRYPRNLLVDQACAFS